MSRPPTVDRPPDGPRSARFTSVAADVWEPLQRYLRRRAAADDVDDIAAETLAVLWRRLDDIPPGAELPWCYSIARRCLANHRRGGVRRRSLFDRITSQKGYTASTADTAAVAVEDSDPELQAAMAKLSTDDRELLTLWAWEQLSVTDLAIALDTTANTVSVRLRRARQRLAGFLTDEHPAKPCHIDGPAGQMEDGRTQETPR